MSIIDSIQKAKERGATDEQILQEISKQNPSKKAVFETAKQRGATSTLILSEVMKQNEKPKKEEKEKKSFGRKLLEGLSSFVGGKELVIGAANVADRGQSEATLRLGESAGKLIEQAKKLPPGDTRRRQLLQQANAITAQASSQAQERLEQLPSSKQVIGSAGQLGLSIGTLGIGAPATGLGRVGLSTGLGAGFGATQGLRDDKGLGGVAKSAAGGAALGAVFGVGLEGVRKVAQQLPKVFSYTSNTPEEILNRQFQRPNELKSVLQEVKVKGDIGVLNDIQAAVRLTRKNLTKGFQDGAEILIQSNQGKRVGFTAVEKNILIKIADQFGIELPKKFNSLSVKEFLAINREVNSLFSKKVIREGAEGVIVRKMKDVLESKASTFNGVKDFLSNYSNELRTFQGVESLFNAFKTSEPKKQAAAMAALKSVFKENKNAYLSALKQLESISGIPLVDKASVVQLLPKLPKGILSGVINLLSSPIRSPRIAGAVSRTAGRISSGVEKGVLQKVGGFVSGKVAGQ